jgi:drug/metabolite transporter (DMT)-like permease
VLGGLLSILSAACFGLNNATVRRGVVSGTVLQGLIISVPIGVPLFFLAALAAGSLDELARFSWMSVFLLGCAGVVHFVLGRYCNYRALKAMGANLTGPVQQISLLVSLAGAVLLLNEHLTPLHLIGIALTFFGPAVMLRGRARARTAPGAAAVEVPKPKPTFEPKYGEGITFALLSTIGYGSSALFIRAAFEAGNAGIGASIAGGLISYMAATCAMVFFFTNRAPIDHVLSTDRRAVNWFIWAGCNVCAAQLFRYMALAVAPVSVVAPLMQLQVVFRWIFGWTMNRDQEIFDIWTFLGMVISLVGALALSVSTDLVLGLAPFPDWVVTAAHWRWP